MTITTRPGPTHDTRRCCGFGPHIRVPHPTIAGVAPLHRRWVATTPTSGPPTTSTPCRWVARSPTTRRQHDHKRGRQDRCVGFDMRQMFRYEMHVTERRVFALSSYPIHVAAIGDDQLEFWAENNDDAPTVERMFLVVGTGHPIPEGARYIGTAPRTPLGLVWHLYEEA